MRRMLLVLFGVMSLTAALRAESDDERFLTGLRQRRLFDLAETFCDERLRDESLSEKQRAELVIEQIRNYAAHALNAPPQQRKQQWDKAADIAEQFRLRSPEHPRLVLVLLQEALSKVAHGELLRQEAEVGAGPEDALESARTQFSDAVDAFDDLSKQIGELIVIRNRDPARGEELTTAELTALENNVAFHLARVYRNQALAYPPGSGDRAASLVRALDTLTEPLKRVPPGDPLVWRILLDQATCQRLKGDIAKAQQALDAITAASAPADVRLAARAETMRVKLAVNQPDAALALVAEGRTIDGESSPELDLALLESYLAKWSAAGSGDAAAQWQQKALAVVKLLEQEHGPYWGRRGDLLLVRTAERGGGGADLEIMIRTADNFYLQKQFDDAIAAYDKAAEKAQAAQDKQRAYELQCKAAAVCVQLKRYDEALRRLRATSIAYKINPQAHQTHFQAVQVALELVRTDAALLDQYIDLLEEQVANWPNASTADQAYLWLGQMRQHQQKWPEAIQAYLRVSPAFPQYANSVNAAAECSRRWFAELKESGRPYEDQAKAAAKFFEDLVFNDQRRLPAKWDDVARLAAVTSARIRLQHTSGGHAEAAALLEPALASSPEADDAWRADATSLLVVALAGQESRRAEAKQTLQRLAEGDPRQLLEMLQGLGQAAQSARPEAKRQMAELLLEAAELLAPRQNDLDAAGQFTLVRTRSEALAALGRRGEAVASYAALAEKFPRDTAIRLGYAQFLLEADDAATLTKALDEWRILTKYTRPNTDGWYEAKYSVARALFKLNRRDEAAQLIRYLQVTPPGLEDTSLKAAFEMLLAKCK